MTDGERWVEIWKGEDPQVPGRVLDAEGIPMRIAQAGHHPVPGLLGIIFRRRGLRARLLVPESERERARTLLKK